MSLSLTNLTLSCRLIRSRVSLHPHNTTPTTTNSNAQTSTVLKHPNTKPPTYLGIVQYNTIPCTISYLRHKHLSGRDS